MIFSLDDNEENWLALAAAVISPKEISVGEVLNKPGLAIPYAHEFPGAVERKERDADILRRYREGQDISDIVVAAKASRATVLKVLNKAGIYFRNR